MDEKTDEQVEDRQVDRLADTEAIIENLFAR